MAELVRHPLGVHLRQRHEAYIEDVGIGYTGLKYLAVNPVEWHWRSPWNPLRPPEPENKGQFQGTALHARFLDGLQTYQRRYGMQPTAKTHPDHLDTIQELLAACRGLGLSTAYVKKDDLVDRLLRVRKVADRPKILEAEMRKFRRAGKLAIEPDVDAKIRLLHQLAVKAPQKVDLPDGSRLTLAQAFKNALTEVSIFWVDENDIRQRARFDLLKPNFSGDVKSITEWRASDFKQSLLREAVIRGYVLQWAHYDEARRQLRIAVDEGRVFGGNKTQRAKLARIAEADEWGWLWVYCKMEGAPQVRGIAPNRGTPRYKKAVEQRQTALDLFSYYRELFGMGEMWVDLDVVWIPEDKDWPPWADLED